MQLHLCTFWSKEGNTAILPVVLKPQINVYINHVIQALVIITDSFTLDADLRGLDLNSMETERQTTSIEQLLLNEKLIINRTTWMDSELEKLGDTTLLSHPERSKETTKNVSFQEQLEQLGLDTSKTTQAITNQCAEMSISARLVFDRLPNLTFMLQNTMAVDQHS